MASEGFDANAYTAPFMLTKSLQRDVYPAVDPAKNQELRAADKVILVTGGAGGIGFAVAKAWSTAGAKGIILLGRTQATLDKAVKDLNSTTTKVIAVQADISSLEDVDAAFKKAITEFGQVDVVVNTSSVANAGPVGAIDPAAWWDTFDVNVKGSYNIAHAFINTTGGKGTFINLVSLLASFAAPGMSGYIVAKLALIKLGELLDLEQPNLRVFSVHPGLVEAENGRGVVIDAFTPFAIDKAALTAGLTLWLSTPKADFLKGGYIHSNWDVTELEQHKSEIVEKKLVKLGFLNAQLQVGGYPWSS